MISLTDIELRRGTKAVLQQTQLVVHPGQKMGLIGANGCGKTSLFKLLLGQITADAGTLFIPSDWRIAHMAQELASSDRSAVDFVMDGDLELRATESSIEAALAAEDNDRLAQEYEKMDGLNGFDARYRAEQLLHGLGFQQQEINQPVTSFSGGWRIRLNLAQALMSPSELMLLDEPTNHLDLDATLWLEQWLRGYDGTLLIISHDRDFIDNVIERIVHIEHQNAVSYKGNYSAFEAVRAERLALQQASYEKQQKRRKDVEEFVARFRYKASKAKQAQSRLKELQRMENIAPAHVDSPFYFKFPQPKKVNSALINISAADLGYPESKILSKVNFDLQPGTRIGLLGPNGAGKSTLINSLTGDIELLAGEKVLCENLKIGYFAQHQLEVLDLQASAFLHLQRITPKATDQEIRNFLGGFDFHNDKALDPIVDFSGGEKARLALAIIVWQEPNLLLLDEPTNHLDLEMRQALTMALQGYDGALVVISHDRHLLRNTVDEFYLVAEGQVREFSGDLTDYQNWLKDYSRQTDGLDSEIKITAVDKRQDRKDAAEERKRKAPLTKRIKQLEKNIEKIQSDLGQLETSLADENIYQPERADKLKLVLADRATLKKTLFAAEDEWMDCQEELEK